MQVTASHHDAELPLPPARDDSDPRISILLVDDEPKNLLVIETILNDPRYRIVSVDSPEQALLALVQQEFALIVLDIQMPGMTGFELASMIKQRKKTASIPIIFLTAYYNDDQYKLEGYITGAVDYLHKPVNPTILRSKVAVFADLARVTREITRTNAALVAEVAERQRSEAEVSRLNDQLEQRVLERTAALRIANETLCETQEFLQLAQAAGQVGTWEWEPLTQRLVWTASAWEILSPGEPQNSLTLEKWLGCVHGDDRERFLNRLQETEDEGRYHDEYRIVTNAGKTRWVEVSGTKEYDQARLVRLRGAVRDVTKRKEYELELAETNRLKDEFLAMLGHEIRNPLAPIRNAVEIMRQVSPADSAIRWCIEILDRQSSQLTRIVDDLLDVARISRGKVQLQMEVFDIALAMERALESSRPYIASRKHELRVTFADSPLYLNGDAARIAQVFANLLNNAAKYTDEGGTIWFSVEASANNPLEMTARVRDNGRGLDRETSPKLFDLFYQVGRDLDRSEGGLGIGLALAKMLVEMHHGQIGVHSAGLGQGSEFAVSLPCARPPITVSPTEPMHDRALDASGLTVMVADDNLDVAQTMSVLLKMAGCVVVLAHDGPEAIRVANHVRPDIIFLDIGLPGVDGYKVCETLRSTHCAGPTIVAMTGYGQEADRQRSQQAGFDEHLVKPVDLALVERSFAHHRSRTV